MLNWQLEDPIMLIIWSTAILSWLIFLTSADCHIICPPKVHGIIRSKSYKKSVACSCSCPVYSQVVKVSTFACWSVSEWLHFWVSMGEFCHKSSHFCVVGPCCGVMLVPLGFAGGWSQFSLSKLLRSLFFFPFISVTFYCFLLTLEVYICCGMLSHYEIPLTVPLAVHGLLTVFMLSIVSLAVPKHLKLLWFYVELFYIYSCVESKSMSSRCLPSLWFGYLHEIHWLRAWD